MCVCVRDVIVRLLCVRACVRAPLLIIDMWPETFWSPLKDLMCLILRFRERAAVYVLRCAISTTSLTALSIKLFFFFFFFFLKRHVGEAMVVKREDHVLPLYKVTLGRHDKNTTAVQSVKLLPNHNRDPQFRQKLAKKVAGTPQRPNSFDVLRMRSRTLLLLSSRYLATSVYADVLFHTPMTHRNVPLPVYADVLSNMLRDVIISATHCRRWITLAMASAIMVATHQAVAIFKALHN